MSWLHGHWRRLQAAFRYLIVIWSLVCASGLIVFLFQALGPSIYPQTGYDTGKIAMAAGFFLFLWLAPVAILLLAGSRGNDTET